MVINKTAMSNETLAMVGDVRPCESLLGLKLYDYNYIAIVITSTITQYSLDCMRLIRQEE